MQRITMKLISETVAETIKGGGISISSTSTNISPMAYQNTTLSSTSSGSLVQASGIPGSVDIASDAIAFAEALLNSIV
jgi:hypothetical protein